MISIGNHDNHALACSGEEDTNWGISRALAIALSASRLIGYPLGNSCRILTEFVGQPLIVQVAFGKNDSYTI